MIAHGPERPSRAVLSYLAAVGEEGVPLTVDARDEMLGHLLREHLGSADAALVAYFQTGRMAAEILRRAIRWRQRSGGGPVRVLDFAAGFGRVSRYLVGAPGIELTVSDLQAEAVEFQRRALGLDGFVSAPMPGQLDVPVGMPGRWDVIWVASLFSHLPAEPFCAWLGWALGRLAPGGVLLFSTHGEAASSPAGRLPPEGIHYEPRSESDRLGGTGYGTSWVGERFVASALEAAAAGTRYRLFPCGLWHSQDLYAVVSAEAASLDELQPPPPLAGYLDGCHLETAHRLAVSGWAAVRGGAGGVPVEVTLLVDGEPVAAAEASLPRPDLEGAAAGGWRLEIERDRPFRTDDRLLVIAAAGDTRYVLQAGSLEGIGLYLRLRAAERRTHRLRHERETARAELGGVRAGLAGESRRVAELDRAVNRSGWERHVLAERLAAVERSRLWRLRRWLRRLTGRGTERLDRAVD